MLIAQYDICQVHLLIPCISKRQLLRPAQAMVAGTQAKKVKGLQAAFKVFNLAMRTPGKGELTMAELRVRAARTGLPSSARIWALLLPVCCLPLMFIQLHIAQQLVEKCSQILSKWSVRPCKGQDALIYWYRIYWYRIPAGAAMPGWCGEREVWVSEEVAAACRSS